MAHNSIKSIRRLCKYISSSIWMECSTWPWAISFTSRLKWLCVWPAPRARGPLCNKRICPPATTALQRHWERWCGFSGIILHHLVLYMWKSSEIRDVFSFTTDWGHGDALSSLRLPPRLLVQLVIFWDLVNKHSQSLTTTKTNDCEISFRAISSSPAKTHCIHMHEIACVNTYYESWVMRWIILSAHNNATASAIRLETIAKPGPCGNILVNCHVWIIKQYTEH